MKFAEKCNGLFDATVSLYHQTDDVDAKVANPYEDGTIEAKLFVKNWIDTVQWHLEDIIRDPEIDPIEALALKRRIDSRIKTAPTWWRKSTLTSARSSLM